MVSFTVSNTDLGVRVQYLTISDLGVGTGASLDSSWLSKTTQDAVLRLNLLCDQWIQWENGSVPFYSRYTERLDVTWLVSSGEQGVLCCDLFFTGESVLASCHARWHWWASTWKFDDVLARATRKRRTKVLRTIKERKTYLPLRRQKTTTTH